MKTLVICSLITASWGKALDDEPTDGLILEQHALNDSTINNQHTVRAQPPQRGSDLYVPSLWFIPNPHPIAYHDALNIPVSSNMLLPLQSVSFDYALPLIFSMLSKYGSSVIYKESMDIMMWTLLFSPSFSMNMVNAQTNYSSSMCCDCMEMTGATGCSANSDCESYVCQQDAFCCDTEWDSICVNTFAVNFCTLSPTSNPTTSPPTAPTTPLPTFDPSPFPTVQPTPSPIVVPIECNQSRSGTVEDYPDSVILSFENLEILDVTFTDCDTAFDPQLYLLDSNGNRIQNRSTNNCNGDNCVDNDYCSTANDWGNFVRETFTIQSLEAGSYSIELTPVSTGGSWTVPLNSCQVILITVYARGSVHIHMFARVFLICSITGSVKAAHFRLSDRHRTFRTVFSMFKCLGLVFDISISLHF